MKKEIILHFQTIDPILASLIEKVGPLTISKSTPTDYFVHLCREIIGQQLSGKVADVIFARFEKLFSRKRITPQALLKYSEETLRSTGMSWSKTRFIRDLAHTVVNKDIHLKELVEKSNEEVIKELTKIKGIGPWTAEMFLMFTLGREDVFSHGDLGLKRAIQNLYDFKKEPTRKQIEKISRKWSPYRTYACRILWSSLDQKA